MKLNIANPTSGRQKTIEIDDEKKMLPFFEKRMGTEVPGDTLGQEFEGYIFRISGGNDKEGFPMMQGVLANHRVRLLFKEGMRCYRPRRTGERKRKSIRGSIVGADLAALNLILVKKGEGEIPGLTDAGEPSRLGPKRASNIRKLFNLSKDQDVRKYVVRRQIEKNGRTRTKAPKIQRLVTQTRLQRKRRYKAELTKRAQKSRTQLEDYKKMVLEHQKHQKEQRAAHLAKKKKA